VITTRTYVAIARSIAVFVALAIQLVAVAVVGDVFVAPSADASLRSRAGMISRVAPLARGERYGSAGRSRGAGRGAGP
jgi:hypothetical protein